MTMDFGCTPVATVAGLKAVMLPDTGLILNPESVFDSEPTTNT